MTALSAEAGCQPTGAENQMAAGTIGLEPRLHFRMTWSNGFTYLGTAPFAT